MKTNGDLGFLGYKTSGLLYYREKDDWFKSALYTEHEITDL